MIQSSKFGFLKQFEVEQRLPKHKTLHLSSASIIDRISDAKNGKANHYNKRKIYWLKSGIIKVVRNGVDGEENLKYLVGAGQFFGELALTRAENPSLFAIAVEECIICPFDIETIKQLMSDHSDFQDYLIRMISNRVELLENRIDQLAFMGSKERVITFLQDFVRHFGARKKDSWEVPNFLKNKEIAQLTFTSRQTVNAVMNQLKKSGQIDFDQSTIKFFDRKLSLSSLK